MITETEHTTYSRQDTVVNSAVSIPDDPELTVVDEMPSKPKGRSTIDETARRNIINKLAKI